MPILYPQNILFKNMRPEEDAELVAMYREHPILFIEQFLWVANKEHGLMRLRLRPDQRLVYELFQETRRQQKLMRYIFCKARQVGISTFIEAWIYTMCRLRANTEALILAHQRPTSEKIFQMFQTFDNNMPPELQPKKKRDTTKKIMMENSSSIETATAGNTDPSRGFALNACHATEVPFYPNAEETITGITNGISKGPESLFVLESTPKGVENYFFDMWDTTLRQIEVGEEQWIAIFLAFWMNAEYEVHLTPDDYEKNTYAWESLSDTERKIVTTCMPLLKGSTFADWQRKLKWRRRTVAMDCHYSERIFAQEYPSDPKSCFLASGESIFCMDSIQWFTQNTLRTNGKRGMIRLSEKGRPFFVEADEYPVGSWNKRRLYDWNEKWPWEIWEDPYPGMRFCLGADGALEGRQKAQQDRKGEGAGDYSACCILSHNRVQVAQYRRQVIDPHDFAEVMAAGATYYNEALIVPEVENGGANSAGYGIQWRLKQIYPLSKIWRWPSWDAASPVKNTGFVGFVPNQKGETVFLSEIMRELRRGAGNLKEEDGEVGRYDRDWPRLKIYSETLLSELSSFKLEKDGQGAGAPKGKHDDLVRAFGLALLGLKDFGPPPGNRNQQEMREIVKDLPYTRFGQPKNMANPGSRAWLLT